MPDYENELGVARSAAELGAGIALEQFMGSPEAEIKPDGTWVTEADRAAEDAIRSRISKVFPQHNILGEEEGLRSAQGADPKKGAPTWIVDPIDGTNNYMRGIPVWATLVGLVMDGSPVVGVCSAPALGERYEAAQGAGARWNGRAIEVDPTPQLTRAGVAMSGTDGFYEAGLASFLEVLSRGSFRTRGFGDFWGHVLVARGALHVMVEPRLSIWDYAPLQPIVSEAGGRMTRLDGGALDGECSCLTTNSILHDEVLRLVEETTPSFAGP
ncbi:MAG: inositol monophosphatase family protein [Actinomycetota bacterium]